MRIKVYVLMLVFCLTFLFTGLGYVQIIRHDRYKVMSEDNRLKIIPLTAPRGSIFDRNGEPMVKDVLSFNASVIYSHVRKNDELVSLLSTVLGVSSDKVRTRIKECKRRPYSPVYVADDIGIEKAIHLEEAGIDYPGLVIEVSAKREYLYGNIASNALGYLGLINPPEFEKLKHYGYRRNDLVGRDGVEKWYDNYLRGRHGGKQIEVDHRGREVTTLGYREPRPGRDVYLTIDLELQKFCDKQLEGRQGVILAMDPESGAILALASSPSFDPSVFVDRSRRGEINDILKNKKYPLINRAVSGSYPLGSIFKGVVAVGALSEGKSGENTVFDCQGSLSLGKAKFRCWKKKGHGVQTLKEALKNSCNVYFFNLGLILGVDGIAEVAGKFGFGKKTGIDLPGEKTGILPTRNWKRRRFNERWYKGDTVNYSIGQGYILCTPVQVVRMMSVFANGGMLVKPYIVEAVGDVVMSSREKIDLNISDDILGVVREGLKKVVNDPRGTGMNAKLDKVVVAGKTGTSQTSKGKNHGWFAGFAPFDNAKMTVVIFDEYGGKGGYYAAGTAKKVLKKAEELGLLQ